MSKQVIRTIGLTENQVQDLFQILDQYDDEEAYLLENVDRRTHQRFPFKLRSQVHLQLLDEITLQTTGDIYIVRVRNLSCGGISLIHGIELPLGQHVRIQFPEMDEMSVEGSVSHIRTLIPPISEYGITFNYPINIDILLNRAQTIMQAR